MNPHRHGQVCSFGPTHLGMGKTPFWFVMFPSVLACRVEAGGTSLLVAVSFALRAREAVSRGMRGTSAPGGGASGDGGNKGGQGVQGRQWAQWERWEGYVRLFDKVDSTWWNAPGHGDWSTCLEQYELCSDGIYHKVGGSLGACTTLPSQGSPLGRTTLPSVGSALMCTALPSQGSPLTCTNRAEASLFM